MFAYVFFVHHFIENSCILTFEIRTQGEKGAVGMMGTPGYPGLPGHMGLPVRVFFCYSVQCSNYENETLKIKSVNHITSVRVEKT